MHYSAFLVKTSPPQLDGVIRDLQGLPGVEVRHRHEPTGRVVVICEGRTLEFQEETLRRVQALAGVQFAALVYHHELLNQDDGTGRFDSENVRGDR